MKRIATLTLTLLFVAVTLGGFFAGEANASVTHTVQRGDTLYLIGQRYGVSASSIKSANGLNSNSIHPGQRLVIPTGNSSSSGNYTVKRGDTLYLIAQKFGVSVTAIKQANNYWKDNIYVGQVLKIPGRTAAPTVSRGSVSRSDMDLLAKLVYGEARGEPYEGQVAIAAVVLNRVKNPNFPNSIRGVIYEPWAFTAINDGQINLTPNQTAYKAVEAAVNGWDPSKGAVYYWNPATASNKWVWSRTIVTRIGNHVFAK